MKWEYFSSSDNLLDAQVDVLLDAESEVPIGYSDRWRIKFFDIRNLNIKKIYFFMLFRIPIVCRKKVINPNPDAADSEDHSI